MNLQKFNHYCPHLKLEIETDKYLLKTADTLVELEQLFRLRHEIFFSGRVTDLEDGLDIEPYDFTSDHLIILDKSEQRIIGTYRVISSAFNDTFYSESEFDLSSLKEEKDGKVELGRACIDKNHRNGLVINLLWRGVTRYLQEVNARFLIGCSSVYTMNSEESFLIYEYMKKKDWIGKRFAVKPLASYSMTLTKTKNEKLMATFDPRELIGPLLRSYISGGSRVYGPPALDKEFECIDFFTLLDINNMTPAYKRRYLK